MRHALPFAAAALALGLAGCAKGPPDSVDRMARAEVEAIVKDYLIKNPEVLSAALEELGRHERNKVFETLIADNSDPTIGPRNAPITIVEFFDYNCGYCKAANPWVFDQVDDKRGDIRVIFKEFPILAESSLAAAKASLAADQQGKYREMHLALMKTKDLSPEGLEKTARSVGLNVEKWNKDMESPIVMEHIERVLKQSDTAGVAGTPGFFINGEFLNGFDEGRLNRIVEDARKETKKSTEG